MRLGQVASEKCNFHVVCFYTRPRVKGGLTYSKICYCRKVYINRSKKIASNSKIFFIYECLLPLLQNTVCKARLASYPCITEKYLTYQIWTCPIANFPLCIPTSSVLWTNSGLALRSQWIISWLMARPSLHIFSGLWSVVFVWSVAFWTSLFLINLRT
jgi:hypothetical protein